MVDVLTDIVIRRPPDEVARYAASPDNAPSWYVNITAVEWQSEPVLRIGARVALVAYFLGRRLEYVYEIADYVPSEMAAAMRRANQKDLARLKRLLEGDAP